MIPIRAAAERPLKPILKRSPSGVRKAVTFSATNSQVFFADDWDRSAVEVVSKLSYNDVLELKQLSLDSLPSDRHASMGLSPLLSHVPLTLCPLACEESKISASPKSESRATPPSITASPLVIPDLSILASPASVNETLRGSPPPPSPVSSEAASSPPVSLGTISPHSSASSPESTPPKTNAQLTAPVPVRRSLMMKFMPLLPEPGSELPSPVLSAASSLSEDSSDTGKTASLFTPQTPTTPRTSHAPHTPTSLSPIPASPTSPTSFSSQQSQGPPTARANKTRTSRAEIAQYSALSGSAPGELGASSLYTPRKPAGGSISPASPISPVSDSTVSVTSSALVRPVPRRAFTAPSTKDQDPSATSRALTRRESFGSAVGDGDEPVTRTKTSRSFDEARVTRLAIASAAWADGALPEQEELPVVRPLSTPGFRQPAVRSSTTTPTRPAVQSHHRSHSFGDAQQGQPQSLKYVNPYAQIRENDEPRPTPVTDEPRQHSRRSSSDKPVQRPRALPTPNVNSGSNVLPVQQYGEDVLGSGIGSSRPPVSMTRPTPTHRASIHGYPYSSGRPPSPTPQTLSRPQPSPLTSNIPLPQARPSKPLASKDANIRSGGAVTSSSYTLSVDGGLGVCSSDRKPRNASDMLSPSPILAPFCAPMARPKNSKVSR